MSMEIEERVSLSTLTTLKTGGLAKYVIVVNNLEELKAAVFFAQQKTVPFFVIGSGSNLLASDDGYQGVIIKNNIKGRTYTETKAGDVVLATFGAGELLDDVIAETVARGYWGLENLSHIPGTIGATPIQNVGAYGVEVGDCIVEVEVFDAQENKVVTFSNHACTFSYRDSFFKTPAARRYIITTVTFKLQSTPCPRLSYAQLKAEFTTDTPDQLTIRNTVISIRNEKFPDWTLVGTAGSFFKNPIITSAEASALLLKYPSIPTYPTEDGLIKVSLGYILDKVCGLRGYTRGAVSLYEKQALVLVTKCDATTSDIESFAHNVQEQVFAKTKINIETEVTKIF